MGLGCFNSPVVLASCPSWQSGFWWPKRALRQIAAEAGSGKWWGKGSAHHQDLPQTCWVGILEEQPGVDGSEAWGSGERPVLEMGI